MGAKFSVCQNKNAIPIASDVMDDQIDGIVQRVLDDPRVDPVPGRLFFLFITASRLITDVQNVEFLQELVTEVYGDSEWENKKIDYHNKVSRYIRNKN